MTESSFPNGLLVFKSMLQLVVKLQQGKPDIIYLNFEWMKNSSSTHPRLIGFTDYINIVYTGENGDSLKQQ